MSQWLTTQRSLNIALTCSVFAACLAQYPLVAHATDLRLPEPASTSTALAPASSVHLAIPERLRQCPAVFEAPKQLARGEFYSDDKVMEEMMDMLRVHANPGVSSFFRSKFMVLFQSLGNHPIIAMLALEIGFYNKHRDQYFVSLRNYGDVSELAKRGRTFDVNTGSNKFIFNSIDDLIMMERTKFEPAFSLTKKYQSGQITAADVIKSSSDAYFTSDLTLVKAAALILFYGDDELAKRLKEVYREVLSLKTVSLLGRENNQILQTKKRYDLLTVWIDNLEEGRRSLDVPNLETILSQKMPPNGVFKFSDDSSKLSGLIKPMTAFELRQAQFVKPTGDFEEFIVSYDRILTDTVHHFISAYGKDQARLQDITKTIDNIAKQIKEPTSWQNFWARLLKRNQNINEDQIITEVESLRNELTKMMGRMAGYREAASKITDLRKDFVLWLSKEDFSRDGDAFQLAQYQLSEVKTLGWSKDITQFANSLAASQGTLTKADDNLQAVIYALNRRLSLPSSK